MHRTGPGVGGCPLYMIGPGVGGCILYLTGPVRGGCIELALVWVGVHDWPCVGGCV